MTRGEEQSRGNAGRVPRQSSLQSARRKRPPLQRIAVAVRDLGRPRGAQQLVSDRNHCRSKSVHRAERCAARGAGEARIHGVHAWAAGRDRSGAHLPSVPLRAARRDLRFRYAQLPWPEHRESSDGAVRGICDPRRTTGRVVETAPSGLDRGVEDHRQRHAAWPRGARWTALRGSRQRRRRSRAWARD